MCCRAGSHLAGALSFRGNPIIQHHLAAGEPAISHDNQRKYIYLSLALQRPRINKRDMIVAPKIREMSNILSLRKADSKPLETNKYLELTEFCSNTNTRINQMNSNSLTFSNLDEVRSHPDEEAAFESTCGALSSG